jgi:hypothetical protein
MLTRSLSYLQEENQAEISRDEKELILQGTNLLAPPLLIGSKFIAL